MEALIAVKHVLDQLDRCIREETAASAHARAAASEARAANERIRREVAAAAAAACDAEGQADDLDALTACLELQLRAAKAHAAEAEVRAACAESARPARLKCQVPAGAAGDHAAGARGGYEGAWQLSALCARACIGVAGGRPAPAHAPRHPSMRIRGCACAPGGAACRLQLPHPSLCPTIAPLQAKAASSRAALLQLVDTAEAGADGLAAAEGRIVYEARAAEAEAREAALRCAARKGSRATPGQ